MESFPKAPVLAWRLLASVPVVVGAIPCSSSVVSKISCTFVLRQRFRGSGIAPGGAVPRPNALGRTIYRRRYALAWPRPGQGMIDRPGTPHKSGPPPDLLNDPLQRVVGSGLAASGCPVIRNGKPFPDSVYKEIGSWCPALRPQVCDDCLSFFLRRFAVLPSIDCRQHVGDLPTLHRRHMDAHTAMEVSRAALPLGIRQIVGNAFWGRSRGAGLRRTPSITNAIHDTWMTSWMDCIMFATNLLAFQQPTMFRVRTLSCPWSLKKKATSPE